MRSAPILALVATLGLGLGGYLYLGPFRDSATHAATPSVFSAVSEELFERPTGESTHAVLRVECDGARVQVFVDGRLLGDRERLELILRSDRVGLAGATFATWKLDPERVRRTCALD
jgi:hypothetical protein